MLKKRLLALALCCVLAAALCMPAAAEPLAAGRKQETHCRFCDYRNVCRRQE